MPIHPELLAILACPKCKGAVEENRQNRTLICNVCELQYEVRGGGPVMLVESAKPIQPKKAGE